MMQAVFFFDNDTQKKIHTFPIDKTGQIMYSYNK